jgi:hypothetical protein
MAPLEDSECTSVVHTATVLEMHRMVVCREQSLCAGGRQVGSATLEVARVMALPEERDGAAVLHCAAA